MLIRRALLIFTLALFCASSLHAQELTVDVPAVKDLVTKWNEAHSLGTVNNLSPLYSNTVNFYGASLQRDRCISIKQDLLKEYNDYNQVLNGDLFLSGYSRGVIRCDFVKTVTQNDTTIDYEAYLIIERISGKYLIVGESDLITDKRLGNNPDFGKKVTIKQRKVDPVITPDTTKKETGAGKGLAGMFQLGIAMLVGVIGLIFVIRHFRKSKTPVRIPDRQVARIEKRSEPVVTLNDDYAEMGFAFEKFVVAQFALHQGFFSLLDWRGDKSHNGVSPQSSRNPDLVYQYKCKDFVRQFSVECKFRSKAFHGSIQLMDVTKYKIYEAYHKTQMPVYIVVGFRGRPNKPEEIFLVPFDQVKLEMHYDELTMFKQNRNRESGIFCYDMHTDRLT